MEKKSEMQLSCLYLVERTFLYDPPDCEVIDNVIVQISRKWWVIGEKLGLTKKELSALQKQPDDKSLCGVLEYWTNTYRKPYTWETFLTALRSNEVDMKEVANEIECKYNLYIYIYIYIPATTDIKGITWVINVI